MSDFDDLAELMAQSPGGENHGKRKAGGSWLRLDNAAHEAIGFEYFVDVEIHGTRPTYQAGCRCAPCRRANATYIRELRFRRKLGSDEDQNLGKRSRP